MTHAKRLAAAALLSCAAWLATAAPVAADVTLEQLHQHFKLAAWREANPPPPPPAPPPVVFVHYEDIPDIIFSEILAQLGNRYSHDVRYERVRYLIPGRRVQHSDCVWYAVTEGEDSQFADRPRRGSEVWIACFGDLKATPHTEDVIRQDVRDAANSQWHKSAVFRHTWQVFDHSSLRSGTR